MKFQKYLGIAGLFAILLPFASSCSQENAPKILRVYNCEDYIYEFDPEDEDETSPGLLEQFETYMLEEYGQKVQVIYDCYDTNESMLSQIKTGKVNYDLILASDYTLQKMIVDDLLVPFEDGNGESTTPIYDEYASQFLLDKLNLIKVPGHGDELGLLNRYSKGYMWGTLGLMYNPEYVDGEDLEEDYSVLWEKGKYTNKISIKDSLRDTYALGIFEAFKDDFLKEREKLDAGEITEEQYNANITNYFNRCDQETVDKVLESLTQLKSNIFGFEVDSGKQDIQTGKIYINLAWSGDATYAMDCALEETETVLKYKVPNIGGNIWFDGWGMTKNADKDLSAKFVDFLSMPESARLNMYGIGYTPFIADDIIYEYLVENYGEAEEDVAEDPDSYFKKDLNYFFGSGDPEDDYYVYIDNELRDTQIDCQYPDAEKLSSLVVMDDFGPNQSKVNRMWEKLKNTQMSTGFYITCLVVAILLVFGFIFLKVYKNVTKKNRIARHKERIAKLKNNQ